MRRNAILVVLVLMMTSELVLGEKFSLTSKGNATAVVEDKKLNLTVETGDVGKYSPKRTFELVIGGCKIAVEGSIVFETQVGLKFTLSDTEGYVNGPITFTVEDGNFKAYGVLNSNPIYCDFKFEEFNDTYKIDVGLSGNVPSNFKLSSETADLYIDPNRNPADNGKLSTAAISGIIGGGLLGEHVDNAYGVRRLPYTAC